MIPSLMIKVGDGGGYSDGDILTADNDALIARTSMQHQPRSQKVLDAIYQYRFERTGPATVLRTPKDGGPTNVVTMDVEEFISRRKRSPAHRIFGSPGREIWHGGHTDFSATAVATALVAAADDLYPYGELDIRSHLTFATLNFTDEEAQSFIAPKLDLTDPDNPIILARRANWVDWRIDILPLLTATEAQIVDPSYPVDDRLTMTPADTNSIVRAKP